MPDEVDSIDTTEATADDAPRNQSDDKPERTFTQAELDRMVRDRLKREREKYADYDELKELAAKAKQLEDAEKSELEKLQARLAETERLAKERETQLKAERQARLVARIAGTLGGIDPYDANFTLATQGVDPDGADAETDIKDILTGLKEAKPYLFRSKSSGVEPFNPGSASGGAKPVETTQERRNRIYSGGGSIWDGEGGGVTFSHPEDAKRPI